MGTLRAFSSNVSVNFLKLQYLYRTENRLEADEIGSFCARFQRIQYADEEVNEHRKSITIIKGTL